MLTPTSIRIFLEIGKQVVLKAKGASALLLAAGVGAATFKAADSLAGQFKSGSAQVSDWVRKQIGS